MQDLSTNQIITIVSGAFTVLVGIIVANIRANMTGVKTSIDLLFREHNKTQSQLDKLQGEHNATCRRVD